MCSRFTRKRLGITTDRKLDNIIRFSINPNSSMFTLCQDSGENLKEHDDYKIHNIGVKDLYAEVLCGTRQECSGVVSSKVIQPGEQHTFSLVGKHLVTGLKVFNRNDCRGILHVEGGEDSFCLISEYPEDSLSN